MGRRDKSCKLIRGEDRKRKEEEGMSAYKHSYIHGHRFCALYWVTREEGNMKGYFYRGVCFQTQKIGKESRSYSLWSSSF